MNSSVTVSIIIPVYNEAQNLRENLKIILENCRKLQRSFQIILIDDGSKDKTLEILFELSSQIKEVKYISFTRNFGKEAAIYAGLKAQKSECAIVMDSDLQHPPELLVDMLKYWQLGIKVVEAAKQDRGNEFYLSKLQAGLFYQILRVLSGLNLQNQSDFKLLDKTIVNAYLSLPEKQRFFRGLIEWFGFESMKIPFQVPDRKNGEKSRWSRYNLFKYAIKNITALSSAPLRYVGVIGLSVFLFGCVFGFISIWQKLNGQALTGFTTLNLLVIIMGGTILICLGILGHYLALIYDELKSRPHYVIKQTSEDSIEH